MVRRSVFDAVHSEAPKYALFEPNALGARNHTIGRPQKKVLFQFSKYLLFYRIQISFSFGSRFRFSCTSFA